MNYVDLPILYKTLFLAGISTIISSILIVVFLWIFRKLWLMDHPERYPHEWNRKPLPYGFWVVLFVNFAVISAFFLDFSFKKLVIILVLWLILWIINLIDDLDTISMSKIKIRPIIRLFLQIFIWAVIWITSIKIWYISNIFWWIIHLDSYFFSIWALNFYLIPIIFTIVWYVLVFNALNWSDAVPWMTTWLSFVSMFIIAILTIKLYIIDTSFLSKENSEFVLILLSILVPSVILFWIFDRKKFLIWDWWTMFLAFMIATLAIISWWKIATVATVLWVYIIDAFYVIFVRLYNKKNPLKWDTIHHLHFRLRNLGFSDAFIRNLVYSLSFMFWLWAIFLDKIGKIIIFSILVIIVVFVTKILSLKK
ncbi:MAG: glycosyl transferase family 4 [uncultured bacterium (gcode 4)]|uniref:Glycosyl transferase family 4 n=1 Tax=uncultured bacterium (gcode 4) TaxID=1234023 RepID=K2FVC0_9BACT|nr:MAG: glycosyl transferase family 4 [uncultured bacterium (gcode 4)]